MAQGSGWSVPRLHVVARVAAAAAFVSLIIEFGFYETVIPQWGLWSFQLLAVIAHTVRAAMVRRERVATKRPPWHRAGVWLAIAASIIALLINTKSDALWVLRFWAIYAIGSELFIELRRRVAKAVSDLIHSKGQLRPGLIMILGFGFTILIGSVVLVLPRAMTPEAIAKTDGGALERYLNALFTSASATCVTGLIVYDTGTDFTRFGQFVILVLIQLGGLGIMVFGGVFGVLSRRQLSLTDSLVLQETINHEAVGEVRRVIRFMLISTFLSEFLGALTFYLSWPDATTPPGDRWVSSVFHAVSAFCNAGFSLNVDSFVGWNRWIGVYAIMMPLIVLGGLGFPVLSDLFGWTHHHVGKRLRRRRRLLDLKHGGPKYRFSLHSRLVLGSTGILIFMPALLFLIFGYVASLRSGPHGHTSIALAQVDTTPGGADSWAVQIGGALFQSVTCRTAGFNTAPLDAVSLPPATHFLMILLMFIGGSPASTAGGIKTTALCVMVFGVMATLRGRNRVEVFGRTIPEHLVRRASTLVFSMFAVASIATLALLASEPNVSVREVLFESVSALGTVGLSMGLTPDLTVMGRIIIIGVMFAGRIGPLTLLVALASHRRAERYQYPSELVVIG